MDNTGGGAFRTANQDVLDAQRQVSRRTRRPPVAARKLIILPSGEKLWHPPVDDADRRRDAIAPAEVWMYLSTPQQDNRWAEGGTAGWSFKDWLTESLQKWANRNLALYVVSFHGALLHGNVLDELDLLSKSSCRWRIIVLTDGSDLTSMAMIDKVLRAGIHELQIYPAAPMETGVNRRTLNVIKDLTELRRARGQSLPTIVCRLAADSASMEEMTQWARQVNIDRLDIVDGKTEENRIWGLWSRNSGEPA